MTAEQSRDQKMTLSNRKKTLQAYHYSFAMEIAKATGIICDIDSLKWSWLILVTGLKVPNAKHPHNAMPAICDYK